MLQNRYIPRQNSPKPSPWGKVLAFRLSKNHVIARQCAHCRGNPPDFQIFWFLNRQFLRSTGGFPHQSEDWFGMTCYLWGFFDTLTPANILQCLHCRGHTGKYARKKRLRFCNFCMANFKKMIAWREILCYISILGFVHSIDKELFYGISGKNQKYCHYRPR